MGVKVEGCECAWAAVLCGPSCRCALEPRAMAQHQASRRGICCWLPSRWSLSSAAPYIRGEARGSQHGEVRGEVNKRGSVHSSFLLRKPLESVDMDVQSPGDSSRQGPMQEPSLVAAGAERRGAELPTGSSTRNGHSLNECPRDPGWGSWWPGSSLSLCEGPTTPGSICCPRCRERTAFQGIPACTWL